MQSQKIGKSPLRPPLYLPNTTPLPLIPLSYKMSSILLLLKPRYFVMPFAVTKEVKITMFQYKVIHNVLPTRTTLYRDGLSQNATCNLCNDTEQTQHHLLIHCAVTDRFWTLFQDWWYRKTGEKIPLSTSHILYGWHDKTKHWQALNYCLLIAKYCIFCTSLCRDELNFQSFLLIIQEKLQIFKEIATATKTFPKYYGTWIKIQIYINYALVISAAGGSIKLNWYSPT